MRDQANILIVDDDTTIRTMMGNMIRHLPLTIQEAQDGQGALYVIKSQDVDVVISDLVMPRMSGLMLLHSMIELGIQVPFILTTGFADKDSAIQALRLGVFDYLEKPIHEADLRSVVEEAIKVSQEQKALLQTAGTGLSQSVQKMDPRARSLIIKMKAFNQNSSGTPTLHETNDSPDQWTPIRDLFVRETLPLANDVIGTLDQTDMQLRPVLGHCLRIAQSIRFAAQALHMGAVAELAWHCELASASLKLVSNYNTNDSIEILKNGFRELRRRIQDLMDPEFVSTISELESLHAPLKKVV